MVEPVRVDQMEGQGVSAGGIVGVNSIGARSKPVEQASRGRRLGPELDGHRIGRADVHGGMVESFGVIGCAVERKSKGTLGGGIGGPVEEVHIVTANHVSSLE